MKEAWRVVTADSYSNTVKNTPVIIEIMNLCEVSLSLYVSYSALKGEVLICIIPNKICSSELIRKIHLKERKEIFKD